LISLRNHTMYSSAIFRSPLMPNSSSLIAWNYYSGCNSSIQILLARLKAPRLNSNTSPHRVNITSSSSTYFGLTQPVWIPAPPLLR
jgi:hypothetical protein